MTYPALVLAVLQHEGLMEPTLLGAGEDAYVFARSDTEAIKIFVEHTEAYVHELAELYTSLSGYETPFECPRIHEIRIHEGVAYTIEAKLPGTPMPEACAAMGGHERQAALESYVRAIGELAGFDAGEHAYGGYLATSVWLTAPSWGEFLRTQMEASLQGFAARLAGDFSRLHATVDRLMAVMDDGFQSAEKGLVHGDYLPQNVLIGPDCGVSAVLDFGLHSAVGDTRLDLCTAVGFLELDGRFAPGDTSYLRGLVERDRSTEEAWLAAVYDAYSAIVLGSTYSSHDGVYRWCLHALHDTDGRF
jgi:hypothetical protein